MKDSKNYVGINIMGHDASVSHIDLKNNRIFAIEEERVTRFKHDGTSINFGIQFLKENLKIEKFKTNWSLSYCYENEEDFRNPKNIWKKIIAKEARKVFKFTEIKQEINFFKTNKIKLFLKLILNLPKSIKLIYILFAYFIFYKYKKNSFNQSIFNYIKKDLKNISTGDNFNLSHFDHHTSHCASSYYFSPFKKCLSISLDFVGDEYFSKVFLFDQEVSRELVKSKVTKIANNEIISIGRIYSYITWFLGFIPNSDEGKVEALAAYGEKNNELYEYLMSSTSINNLNEIVIDKFVMKYLVKNLNNLKIKLGEKNIAAAVQGYLEDFVVEYVKKIASTYQIYDIVLSGGTFANVKLNMSIFERSGVKNIYIIPAMSDSGAGLGALLLKLKQEKKITYDYFKNEKFIMPYWGPKYSSSEIMKDIESFSNKVNFKVIKNGNWTDEVAKLISDGKIGGVFHGRMEFGPRALGNRSILGDARNKETKNILNKIIKGRPHFQPFCPSILEEERNRLFERSYPNKHMTCAFKMRPEYAKLLPSAVHIDDTARPQFVEKQDNENFYNILKKIKQITDFGVVVNTSFNKHGRTMVLKPSDAIIDFLDSQMDFVSFENIFVYKK